MIGEAIKKALEAVGKLDEYLQEMKIQADEKAACEVPLED